MVYALVTCQVTCWRERLGGTFSATRWRTCWDLDCNHDCHCCCDTVDELHVPQAMPSALRHRSTEGVCVLAAPHHRRAVSTVRCSRLAPPLVHACDLSLSARGIISTAMMSSVKAGSPHERDPTGAATARQPRSDDESQCASLHLLDAKGMDLHSLQETHTPDASGVERTLSGMGIPRKNAKSSSFTQ